MLGKIRFFNNSDKKNIEIKKDTIQRILKKVFWFLLIFLVFKSVVNDVFEPEQKIEIPEIKIEQQKPGAVAASFIKEYLTYDIQKNMNEDNDYRNRVYKYAAQHIKFPNLSEVQASSKVEDIFVFDINKINENQYDVTIKADVIYDFPDSQKKTSIIYLIVPIAQKEGKYVVEDTPVIIPPPEKADINYERFSTGEELYITEKNKVKEIMENFFKTYSTGQPTEIAYYMADGKPLKGFEGRFNFLSIKEFNVFHIKAKEGESTNNEIDYKAIALIEIKDLVSGKVFYQNYNIDLIKKDERWYVKSLNIRGGNIK